MDGFVMAGFIVCAALAVYVVGHLASALMGDSDSPSGPTGGGGNVINFFSHPRAA